MACHRWGRAFAGQRRGCTGRHARRAGAIDSAGRPVSATRKFALLIPAGTASLPDVGTSKRKKAEIKRQQRKRAAASRDKTRQVVRTTIPRPRVTEYNYTSAVPAFPGWNGGSPSGSPGLYDVVFVLGVPGVSGVARALDFDGMMAGGDSLLEGTGVQIELQSSDGSSLSAARIIPNAHGRLAQVRLTVAAGDFSLAENEAFDAVMPTLSRIAFEADTPLEVTGILLTEQATQTRRFGATLVGAVQPAPELAGTTTPELRMFLAAYREGLNANSPLYQTLSFYKIIEGVATFHKNRVRAAKKRSATEPADPLAKQIPANREDLVGMTNWARDNFTPYLGLSFGEIRDAVKNTIRDAVAHITPGMDLRIADYAADIRACRAITPVLRYVARELICEELAGLAGSGSAASTPAA
jgi:hypothetical protein